MPPHVFLPVYSWQLVYMWYIKNSINLLFIAGTFGPCPALYEGMEIKHIMNDTLG